MSSTFRRATPPGVALSCAALLAASCTAEVGTSGAISLRDDTGRTVALDSAPARIVSLVPSVTESILALGAADVLVARTMSDREPQLEHLPIIGGTLRPNLEALVGLRPDLVFLSAAAGQEPLAKRIEALGLPVYVSGVRTLDDVPAELRRLGVLLGRAARAEAVADSLSASLDRTAEAVAGRPSVEVYYSLWHDPPQTAGAGTFVHGIISVAGGRNVMADAPGAWPLVSLEELVQRDPDVLVIARQARGVTDPPWLRRPGWRELTAVREGRYLVVDADLFNRPGPRVHEAVRMLARFLHGGGMPEDRSGGKNGPSSW